MTNNEVSTADVTPQREKWRIELRTEIAALEERFHRNKDNWNKWYYFLLAGGIGLPALSALLLKLEKVTDLALKNDIAAILAVLGAVSTSMMATFNIQKRWAISRTTRTELNQIKVDVLRPDANLSEAAERLKKTLAKYNDSVVDDA